ncbi:glycosidase crf1 [Tolypocladium capitatum]|uniref:Glycosidase crf1 n=1 Tax=Tolypocladium capitatum TaxID=45235 RepID=A0A2K3QBP7_9HYPO|nr:glycosidase crf1 [Tolypocladium capitatum]
MLPNIFVTVVLAVPAMAGSKDLAGCDALRILGLKATQIAGQTPSLPATPRRGKGVAMGMWKAGDAPRLTSRRYLLFGKISATVQAARGPGLISALVMKSGSADEIDWTWHVGEMPQGSRPQTPMGEESG